jgi:hypothetical protein
LWEAAFNIAKNVCDTNNIKVTANETRWNSKFRVMQAAHACLTSVPASSQAEVQEAMLFLEPFAIITDILQSDDASLWDTMRCFEALSTYFGEMKRNVASSPLGRARHTSILQIESVLETRSRMLFIKPYLMIAYFSPTLDRSTSTAELVAPIVKNMLVLLDAEIELEWQRWTILVLDVVEGPVSREAYVEHLLPLKKVCPKMHGIIINALGATPSEAAVERLFSRLKFTYNALKSRTRADSADITMQAVSLWHFFHPPRSIEDVNGEPQPETPWKRNRTESSTQSASPNPSPPAIVVEAEAEVVDDEGSFEVLEPVGDILHNIIVWNAPPQERAERPVPASTTSRTRSAADACHDCHLPCRTHQMQAYIVCDVCASARRSVVHAPTLARTLTAEEKSTHARVAAIWTCKSCVERGRQ